MKNVKSIGKLVLTLFIIYTFFVSWILYGLFLLGGETMDLNTPISLLILPSPLLLIISSTLFIVSSKKKSLKIIFYSIIGVTILGIFALSFFTWIKPNKSLKFETDTLISITIKTREEEIVVLKEDFEDFIIDINSLKYKEKEVDDNKTKGNYFIILEYYYDEIELGKYWSLFYGQYRPTLFKDDFDRLAQRWIDKYKN